jgi:cytochrome c oxidase subunit 2
MDNRACLILIVIVVPSMKLLYYTDRTEKPDMTLKVTGYQWYWGYEYPDQGRELRF